MKRHADRLLYTLFLTAGFSALSGMLIAWNMIPVPGRAGLSLEHIRTDLFLGSILISMHQVCAMLVPILAICYLVTFYLSQRKNFPDKLFSAPAPLLPKSFLISSFATGMLIILAVATGLLLSPSGIAQDTLVRITPKTASEIGFFSPLDKVSFTYLHCYLIHCFMIPALLYPLLCHIGGINRRTTNDTAGKQKHIHLLIIIVLCTLILLAIIAMPWSNPGDTPVAKASLRFINTLSAISGARYLAAAFILLGFSLAFFSLIGKRNQK